MGAIISRFRKEKTTYQLLENLEIKIKDIEEYTLSTQENQKRVVGNFLVISIGLLVVVLITFYFIFFPETWEDRFKYSMPIALSPFLIYIIKRIFAWYYQRKLNNNCNKLNQLRAEKKKIIEKVMEKETYKVAIEILNKFGDRTQMRSSSLQTPRPNNASTQSTPTLAISAPGRNNQLQPRQLNTPSIRQAIVGNPQNINQPFNRSLAYPSTPVRNPSQLENPLASINRSVRTPYPIVDETSKTILEKMVDYLIGDGPNNRFAMICKECLRHNGMTSQEEYEYAAFRCAFCNTLNPSRKLRPAAPKLPDPNNLELTRKNSETTESDADSINSETDDKESVPGKVPQLKDNDDNENKTAETEGVELSEEQPQNDEADQLSHDNSVIEQKSAMDKKTE